MAGPNGTSPDLLVTNVVLTTIRPLQKRSHVESIDPTSLDTNFADLYVPTLFAYRLADNAQAVYSQLVSQVKEALQKVLMPFFPFAGRWIADPPGSNGRKLLCNDEGVPFIEAFVDKDLDSVVHASVEFQVVPELHGYGVLGMDMTLLKQQLPPGGLPPIFVQATRFKCGGLVLAVTFNHIQTDAKGFFDFMTAWSDLCRTNETAIKVDHNRAVADVPSLRKLEFEKEKASTTGDYAHESPTTRPWATKVFEVSSSAMKSIKQEAKDNKNGPGFVSTADCIAAHLWRSLSRLPSSSMLGGREPVISIAVEGRSKFFDPPLPDSLSANVIAPMVPTRIPTKELQEKPLALSASKIREQFQTTRREEWLDVHRWQEIIKLYASGKCAVIAITSWLKFPMYEMDFGVGKPFFASSVSDLWIYSRPPHFIASASIGPPIPSSSSSLATVGVFSFPEVLQILENDPLFLSFFLQY